MPEAIRAIVVMGVSGSGKTTVAEELARRLGWGFADGDAFHPKGNVEKMRGGQPLTDEDRWPWLRAIAAEIGRHDGAGKHLVIACSALKRSYRNALIDRRTDVRLVYLQGGRDLIMERLQRRKDHYMPPGLLDSQFAALEEPDASERALAVAIDRPVGAIVEEIMQRLGSGTG